VTEPITETTIQTWLADRVVEYGKASAGSFTIDTRLPDLGIDSVYALTLCGDIEDHFDIDIDPTMLWDLPTIRELAGALAGKLQES
jgi:acyl carrier protein